MGNIRCTRNFRTVGSSFRTYVTIWCNTESCLHYGAHPLHYRKQLLDYGILFYYRQQALYSGEDDFYCWAQPYVMGKHFVLWGTSCALQGTSFGLRATILKSAEQLLFYGEESWYCGHPLECYWEKRLHCGE